MPDQLRPDFLGCYGAGFIKTPNIDALAAQGTRYAQAISPVPLCVPARASMLTGLPAHATGVFDNTAWLRPDRRDMGIESWPERLSAAGYQTAAIGKMHFYPRDIFEGFQDRIISEDKRHVFIEDDYDAALKETGFRKLHGTEQPGYVDQQGASINELPAHLQPDRWVADQAAHYLRARDRSQPFAAMVGFPGPHCPYDPMVEALAEIDPDDMPDPLPPSPESKTHHEGFVEAYKAPWAQVDYATLSSEAIRRIRHHYAALVEQLDHDVGTVIQALKDTNELKNTIVVFGSDHGDYLGDFGFVGKSWFHEPSIRVPLIVCDFRAPAARVCDDPVSLIDLYHSFGAWAGLPPLDTNWAMTLDAPHPDRCIIGVSALGVMARDRRWKLVRYDNGTEALFDLTADPGEQQNVLDANPKVRARLDAAIVRDLIAGQRHGHADKIVPRKAGFGPNAFHRRNWPRPYPSRIGHT